MILIDLFLHSPDRNRLCTKHAVMYETVVYHAMAYICDNIESYGHEIGLTSGE